MLGNLKDLYQLQSQARELQKKMADEKIEVEKDGNQIVMNGNFEILEIKLNAEKTSEENEKILKELFNSAIKQVQQKMAHSMMGGGA